MLSKTRKRKKTGKPMKKLLLTTILTGHGLAAFGIGQIVLENNYSSSSFVTLNAPGIANAAPIGNPGFAVSLLWYNGSSFQTVATYQTTSSAPGAYVGQFDDPVIVTLPTFSVRGTFEVEAWYNPSENIGSYATALATPGTYVGETASFIARESPGPPSPPGVLVGNIGQFTGQWDGNLVLTMVPEPSTVTLSGIGAAALWFFRRRK